MRLEALRPGVDGANDREAPEAARLLVRGGARPRVLAAGAGHAAVGGLLDGAVLAVLLLAQGTHRGLRDGSMADAPSYAGLGCRDNRRLRMPRAPRCGRCRSRARRCACACAAAPGW